MLLGGELQELNTTSHFNGADSGGKLFKSCGVQKERKLIPFQKPCSLYFVFVYDSHANNVAFISVYY